MVDQSCAVERVFVFEKQTDIGTRVLLSPTKLKAICLEFDQWLLAECYVASLLEPIFNYPPTPGRSSERDCLPLLILHPPPNQNPHHHPSSAFTFLTDCKSVWQNQLFCGSAFEVAFALLTLICVLACKIEADIFGLQIVVRW